MCLKSIDLASKNYGSDIARKIIQRLYEIQAANSLNDLNRLPPTRCHRLKGNKKFTSQNMISKLSIINFAKSIGIHPCMIVGRLQHDEYIGYNQYTELIPKIS
ncbi:hypothetical protein psyc5s11_22220 [Clostridium gelidum]|uniref:Uncharacterized protein n=2 Tax=Clostridium gelidum TaxID=704125 RepID=A0ABM7T5D1_9CLOT|nr:hypothetical protein psyc5s11_22220 [Clostridium gelidum]